jgi:hypothetical protein
MKSETMPLFHLAVDIIERDWITVDAPDLKTAYEWGKARATEVYQENHHVYGKDLEFGHDTEPVPPEEEKDYRPLVKIVSTDNRLVEEAL